MKKTSIANINIKNLSLQYPTETILEDARISIPEKSLVWVTGGHSSGKSTLMKSLVGLVIPTSGEVQFDGVSFNNLSFEEALSYRMNIGYSFDYGGLINNKTVYENLALPLEYHRLVPRKDIRAKVNYYIDYFCLTKASNQRPSAISGGMRKAACVARAFVTDPQVLILDDPTTGMRGGVKKKLYDLIMDKFTMGHLKFLFLATEDKEFLNMFDDLKCLRIIDHKLQYSNEVPGVQGRGVA